MNDDAKPAGEKKVTRELRPRHELLARFIGNGDTHSDAYRKAYGKMEWKPQAVARAVYKVLAANPAILDRADEILKAGTAKAILSIQDRLGILARDAQLPGAGAAMVNARARSIEVYGRLAGDLAPERLNADVTVKGDPSSPLHVVHRPATKAEKVAALRARRAAQSAPLAAATPAPVPQPVSA